MMGRVEEVSHEILRYLLADFVGRALTAGALRDGYVGVTLAVLRECLSGGTGASSVDFDLAFKDLEERGLVDTGPLVPHHNPPGSSVVVLGSFSSREYACLTEKGYKIAQKSPFDSGRKSTHMHVNISGGHFRQSPIGIGDNVAQSIAARSVGAPIFADLHKVVEESSIEDGDRRRLLEAIEAMERAQGKPGFRDSYRQFIALAADYMTLIGPYVPALATLAASHLH